MNQIPQQTLRVAASMYASSQHQLRQCEGLTLRMYPAWQAGMLQIVLPNDRRASSLRGEASRDSPTSEQDVGAQCLPHLRSGNRYWDHTTASNLRRVNPEECASCDCRASKLLSAPE